MRKFMSMQSFRHPKLQNPSNGDDFMGCGRILLTTLSYLCTKTNKVLVIFLCTRIKSTL